MKDDLTTLSHYAFDAHIEVLPDDDNRPLLDHVTVIAATLPADRLAKVEALRKSLIGADPAVKRAYAKFVRTVRNALTTRNSFAESVWRAERACVAERLKHVRSARPTALRRGLSSCLSLRIRTSSSSQYMSDALLIRSVSVAAGLMTRSIRGMRITDADLNALPTSVSKESLLSTLRTISAQSAIRVLIAPVHELPVMKAAIDQVATHWTALCSPEALWLRMTESHADPLEFAKILGVRDCAYVRPGIVADSALAIMRCASKKRQFFGNAGLI